MKNILIKSFKVGDKVLFLGTKTKIFDPTGLELYVELNPGQIYTVKEVYMISVKLEEFDGIYLKEYFRKVKHD